MAGRWPGGKLKAEPGDLATTGTVADSADEADVERSLGSTEANVPPRPGRDEEDTAATALEPDLTNPAGEESTEAFSSQEVISWTDSDSPAEPRVSPLPLVTGAIIGERWRIVSDLTRRGASAQVYRVADESRIYQGRVFALKLIVPHLSLHQLEEVGSLLDHSHPHLVKMVDAGHHSTGGSRRLYIVMEWADEDLSQLLRTGPRPIAEVDLRHVVNHVLDGLAALHTRGIHRDIKPANILRCGGVWKLGDFGLYAAAAPGATIKVGCSIGTPNYAAPELLGKDARASTASDVFAVGATVHRVLTGRPVWSEAAIEARRKFGTAPPSLDLSARLGDWAEFIRSACQWEAENRPAIPTLKTLVPGADKYLMVPVPPMPPPPERQPSPYSGYFLPVLLVVLASILLTVAVALTR